VSDAAPPFDPDRLQRGGVRVHRDGPVLSVVLNRPDNRNAQLPPTWDALRHIGDRLDDGVRVVTVTGSGTSFSAGLDRSAFRPDPDSLLGLLARAPDSVADEMISEFQDSFSWLAEPRFVSVAAVHGHAIGAGFQLALACDLIVCAQDARFSMAEVTLGLVPDLGGTRRLADRVGRSRALEMCVTGRRVGADEAVRTGLALLTVPGPQLEATLADLVASLLDPPADAVRAVTRLFDGIGDRAADDQLAVERAEQITRIRALSGSLLGQPRS
jgi:enoyl-CoA hydratase/carnithine racemase